MPMNCINHTAHPHNFSCYSPSADGYRYFAVLWGCAVTVVGTVGNLMTFLAFALQPNLRTRFNVLILNLALVDLLYCTVLYPISVDSYLHLRWRTGQLWCSIFSLVFFVLNAVSIGTLCLIAGARYLMVAKRAVFDRVFSDLGLSLLIISQWALALVTLGPLWPANRFDPKVCVCNIDHSKYHPYPIILLTFYFFGGLICVGTFYLLIYRHVQKSSQALLRYRFSPRRSGGKPDSPVQDAIDSGIEISTANTCGQETISQDEINSENSSQSAQSSAAAESATESPSEVVTASPSPTPAPANAASSPPRSSASGDDEEMTHVAAMCLAVLLGFVSCF
uniref:G-protein coupled receptors family 1 profile domain-containing protein n=2 Tax=Sparus aurata TaxID=8175 RepID=A0A671UX29_SPAAU